MNWQSYLRTKTRQPEFLWRMVLSIVGLGVVLGFAAQTICQPLPAEVHDTPREPSAWKQLEKLAEQGEWAKVWWRTPAAIYSRFTDWGPPVLAAVAGVCWLVFLLQAMQIDSLRDGRLGCTLLAIALGILSIWPTGFFILWQEIGWGLRDSQELIAGVRYNVLGVGLREEFAKLCCLLPLMPLLLRWQSELSALLISSCVGLGFAIEENVGYFSSDLSSTMGRFLTANPAHIALTGLIGLAAYRLLRNPRGWGPHALGVFGLLVFAHGLYDAFIAVPALREYSLFGTIIFALVIYQFFHELRDLRTSRGDTISLSANFLCGMSVLTATTFVYLSATLGMSIAFDTLASSVVGLAVMVYLFLREMPESMVGV